MMPEPTPPSSPTSVTPFGRVGPTHERATRAVKAIEENRLEDARRNAEAIPDAAIGDRAWKLYLLGRLRIENGELTEADAFFQNSAALAVQWGLEEPSFPSHPLRLAAEALEALGRCHRRREALDYALHAHQAAYHLRCEHGSAEEQWESAESLSLDFMLSRKFEEARTWSTRAVQHATTAGDPAFAKRAKSQGSLCTILVALGQFQPAVAEARAACELWRRWGPGERARFRAEMDLGDALLRQAQVLVDADPATAKVLLDDAFHTIENAQRELSAFGPDAADDVQSCHDLLDFTGRLLASVS